MACADDKCIHYRVVDGQAAVVEKGEPYDYASTDPDLASWEAFDA